MSDELPFRCCRCGAFVGQQRLHEADDFGPMPCKKCKRKKKNMSEYTPSLDEARDRYADARAGVGEWTRFDDSVKRAAEDAYAEFDRMVAGVRAEALREAREMVVSMERAFVTSKWGTVVRKLDVMEALDARIEREVSS